MTRIIGLGGPKGSGKTTIAKAAARQLIAAGHEVATFSFADPIKEMLVPLMDYVGVKDPRSLIREPERKEQPLPELQGRSFRHIAQTLGTEWGRQMIGVNLWTDICMERIAACNDDWVIIDDVRFESEASAITDRGGKCFNIRRPSVEYEAVHASEVGINAPRILNDSDPETVAKKVLASL